MKNRFIYNSNKTSGQRVKDKNLQLPKIIAEFYVRLASLLGQEPEVRFEGYESYIKDPVTGIEFSAGLSGFGPGYFCNEDSPEALRIIDEFDKVLFSDGLNLVDCRMEYFHDFGKTILSCKNGVISKLDI